jgi:hypothetical protein
MLTDRKWTSLGGLPGGGSKQEREDRYEGEMGNRRTNTWLKLAWWQQARGQRRKVRRPWSEIDPNSSGRCWRHQSKA